LKYRLFSRNSTAQCHHFKISSAFLQTQYFPTPAFYTPEHLVISAEFIYEWTQLTLLENFDLTFPQSLMKFPALYGSGSFYYRVHNSGFSQRAFFVCALKSWVHFTKQNWCLFCRKRTNCLSESQNNSIHFMTYRRTNAIPIKSSMNACIHTHTNHNKAERKWKTKQKQS
jgi:hypothetical protein